MKPGDTVRIDAAVFHSHGGNLMVPNTGRVESVYPEDGDAVVVTRYGRIICEMHYLAVVGQEVAV